MKIADGGTMKKIKLPTIFIACLFLFLLTPILSAEPYQIIDTDQTKFFNELVEIPSPQPGEAFYGQDAGFTGIQPSYQDNGDGTVTDLNTGLMWQQNLFSGKLTYEEAVDGAEDFDQAGYTDWRLPAIKELYSLIDFCGIDPSGYEGNDVSGLTPFIDTDYFEFRYGDPENGERLIDAQYVSSTEYVGTTMSGDFTVFGVNFADGRIKGYGTILPGPGGGQEKTFEVRYVRGNPDYGDNDFIDNGNGTISDLATGLMWSAQDNGTGLTWQEALAWVEQQNVSQYLGYSDWRLPNIKELQSIVDYSRAPDVTGSAALDPVFSISTIINPGGEIDYPYFWSGTTHENYTDLNGGFASYVCFGRGLGWMEMPPESGNYQLLDVHGAGCQRSDPKAGDPEEFPFGHGPQGDVISIYNFVRLVRDLSTGSSGSQLVPAPEQNSLQQNYPNPSNPYTYIPFTLKEDSKISVGIYDITGRKIATLVEQYYPGGSYTVQWDGLDGSGSAVSSGLYFYQLRVNGRLTDVKKCLLLK